MRNKERSHCSLDSHLEVGKPCKKVQINQLHFSEQSCGFFKSTFIGIWGFVFSCFKNHSFKLVSLGPIKVTTMKSGETDLSYERDFPASESYDLINACQKLVNYACTSQGWKQVLDHYQKVLPLKSKKTRSQQTSQMPECAFTYIEKLCYEINVL